MCRLGMVSRLKGLYITYTVGTGIVHAGSYRQGLRKLMSELLGIRMHYELSFGSSRNEHRGLNAFISSWYVGMAPPAEEAWFVLNVSPPVYSRKVPMPDLWFRFNDWK